MFFCSIHLYSSHSAIILISSKNWIFNSQLIEIQNIMISSSKLLKLITFRKKYQFFIRHIYCIHECIVAPIKTHIITKSLNQSICFFAALEFNSDVLSSRRWTVMLHFLQDAFAFCLGSVCWILFTLAGHSQQSISNKSLF